MIFLFVVIDEANMLKYGNSKQGNALVILSRDGGMADAKDLKSFVS